MTDLIETETDEVAEADPKKPQPFRRMIPNLLTIAGLCCGLSSVRFALLERWEMCIAFLLAAAIIDGLDGSAARLLRASSRFGAQLDSLSDFVCFGVAPVLVMYIWQLNEVKRFGWAVVLFYAICAAFRLARFNTALEDENPPKWHKQFFTGLPSPAAGLLTVAPLAIAVETEGEWTVGPAILLPYIMLIGLLMISRIPTFAAKNVRIRPDHVLPVMVLSALIVVITLIEPWWMLLTIGLGYLCSIPFSIRSYHRLKKAADII